MKFKMLHFRVENRKAKADLENHRQETYSHKSRDLVKIPIIKNSSSMKVKCLIILATLLVKSIFKTGANLYLYCR